MDVALLSFGVILFLLGLIGKVEAEKIKVGSDNYIARIISGIVGITFILLALSKAGLLPTTNEESYGGLIGTWSTTWGETLDV